MPKPTLLSRVGWIAQRRPAKILIDAALLIAFVIVFVTKESTLDHDYTVHSIVGLGIVPIVSVHLAGNMGWIARLWRNKRHDREARLGATNVALAVATAVCVASGLPLWLGWTRHSVFINTHAASGFGSIAVVFFHVVMNRRRIVRLLRPGT